MSYRDAAIYAGLHPRTLQSAANDGAIVVSRLRRPGTKKGRTLVCRESLDKWIEEGVARGPTECAMNKNRKPANR